MGTTVVIGVLIVAMLVLMFTGTRKQKKMMAQRYEMLDNLLPGDRVITTAGMYATVVKVRETEIDLMISDGFVTTWDLNAVRGKVEEEPSEFEKELEQNALSDDEISDGFPNAEAELESLSDTEIPDTIEGIEDTGDDTSSDTTDIPEENSDK